MHASVRQILDQSHRGWTGYSFSWAASLAARAGFADDAARHLVDFERAFVARNGFHLNGDQTWTILTRQRRRGSRDFTLEGNFLFMDAIHEMVMQSVDGKVRIFPTMPHSWKDAEFTDLRAEGGFKVSAKRVGGVTTEVEIAATCDAVLKVRDPFPGCEAKERIASRGVYGQVSAETYDGKNLPFGDDIVNLVIVEDAAQLSATEIERALVPRPRSGTGRYASRPRSENPPACGADRAAARRSPSPTASSSAASPIPKGKDYPGPVDPLLQDCYDSKMLKEL